MITQNSGIDAVKKCIEDEMKRSEQLKALITPENKETIVKVLEIVYDLADGLVTYLLSKEKDDEKDTPPTR